MTDYTTQIVEYMETRRPNPVGYKNVAKNTGISPKHAFRTLVRSSRFEKVRALQCGSGSNIRTYFVLSK
jgi:hypothetical protein